MSRQDRKGPRNSATKKNSEPYGETFTLLRGKKPKEHEIRFKKYSEQVILIDESGTMAHSSEELPNGRNRFVVVASLVRDLNSFKKIWNHLPKKGGNEPKFTKLTRKDTIKAFDALSHVDFKFTEKSVSKLNDKLRDPQGKIDEYIKLVSESIDALEPYGELDIIIDRPPVKASKQLVDLCRMKIKEGMNIKWFEVKSSSGDHLLQVHDLITGITAADIERIENEKEENANVEDSRYSKIKSKRK